jgi:SPX domain protein involved in polyphosphate accumulation
MLGRKTIVCKRCGREKIHYGLGMCSACLRQYKRRTRPSFYLGTCYSEIKRRCTHETYGKRNYKKGMKFCTKKEFFDKFLNDKNFLKQYKIWQESEFKRGLAPSIDRINSNGDYLINNLRFISNIENAIREKIKKVQIYKKNILVEEFCSQADAARFLNISPAAVCKIIKNKSKNKKGYEIRRDK